MKPPPFKYIAPNSLEEALELMAEHGDEAKILAGGQSLIPAMNFRVLQPSVLVDLNRVAELDYIREADEGALAIGAMTRQRAVEVSGEVEHRVPLMHEAMPHVAHPQIRTRGTVGGSLVHADPAAELPAVAIAAGAKLKVAGAEGNRWIGAADCFVGMFTTKVQPGEILLEVAFPAPKPGAGWSFMESSRRRGDYAMMGVAVSVRMNGGGVCERARLVYLNAGDGPIAASVSAAILEGERPSQEAIAAAAAEASENEIDPFGNVHATADFQRHLARVLTERALERAFQRAAA